MDGWKEEGKFIKADEGRKDLHGGRRFHGALAEERAFGKIDVAVAVDVPAAGDETNDRQVHFGE